VHPTPLANKLRFADTNSVREDNKQQQAGMDGRGMCAKQEAVLIVQGSITQQAERASLTQCTLGQGTSPCSTNTGEETERLRTTGCMLQHRKRAAPSPHIHTHVVIAA
jgi:hypothetical protein